MGRGGGCVFNKVRRITSNESRMQSEQNVPLYSHLPLTALLHPGPLSIAVTLLTAEDVAADAFVEHAKSVGHEVADVGQIEEGQRNAKQSVDDGHDAT